MGSATRSIETSAGKSPSEVCRPLRRDSPRKWQMTAAGWENNRKGRSTAVIVLHSFKRSWPWKKSEDGTKRLRTCGPIEEANKAKPIRKQKVPQVS